MVSKVWYYNLGDIMSKVKEEVEVDIKRFFEQIENQSSSDKLQTLRNLLDKHIHLTTSDYMMDYHDLNAIVSHAKGSFVNKTFPVFLGDKKRKVGQNEQANLCVIEATISHLNKNDCLKRLPKFKYKEDKI
jgi:hypothetical protein